MKKIIALAGFVLSTSLFASSAVFAEAPSDASLKELLTISDTEKMIDNYFIQVDNMMKSGLQQATAGQQLNSEQQKIMEETQAKTLEVFKADMSWEKMQPIFIKVYKESLTQEEVDGIVTFYKSPAGVALVKKMPLIMQTTMNNMQTVVQGMIPKLQKIQQDSIEKMKAKATK